MFLLMGCLMSAEEYSELQIRSGDSDGDGYADAAYAFGDGCDDGDVLVNPGAVEVAYNGLDDDCDPRTPDDDLDLDGVDSAEDCDDSDPERSPELSEVWYDGVDQDCDGNDTDQDLDGEPSVDFGGQDCDDTDPSVQMRSWHVDGDRDGYGDVDDVVFQCEPVDGRQELGDDCDDRDPDISPDALEVCNDGVDNDCSGDAPECEIQSGELVDAAIYVWHGDEPGDGFGSDHGVADLDGDGELEFLIGARNAGCVYAGDTTTMSSECSGGGELLSGVGDVDGNGDEEMIVGSLVGALSVYSGALDSEDGGPVFPPVLSPGLVNWLDVQELKADPEVGTFVTLQVGESVQDFVTSYALVDSKWERPWGSYFDRGVAGSSRLTTGDFYGGGTEQVVVYLQRSDDVRQVFVWTPEEGVFGGLENSDFQIGARPEAVDGLANSDVNGDGYADLLVSTVLSESDSSLFVALGPDLPFELGGSDAEVRGAELQLGEDVCVATVKSTGLPILIVAKPDGIYEGDGGLFGMEIPTTGVSDLSEPMWSLSSPEGRAGSKVTCLNRPELPQAVVLVSRHVDSTAQHGEVYLLPIEGL